jgi:hypothetical protein
MPVANLTVFGKLARATAWPTRMKTRHAGLQQAAGAQQSHDAELGLSYANAMQKITARVFRHNLTNEIFYDPTLNFWRQHQSGSDPPPGLRAGCGAEDQRRVGVSALTSTCRPSSAKASTTARRWCWCRRTR